MMRHKNDTIGGALAWAMILCLGGCAVGSAPPATRPAALDVPMVYSTYLKPERLNDAQQRQINAVIAEAQPKAGQPWFVYVRYSDDGTYRVIAYFRPTGTLGAVQRGSMVFVDNDIPIDERRPVVRQLGGQWPVLHPYIQLAARAPDPAAIPAEVNLPFRPPGGLSDNELIQLVKAARAAAIKEDSTTAKMPIRSIEVGEDGTVSVFFVFFGWQAGGLNGRGAVVELKRSGAGFIVSSVGMWVS